MRENVKKQISNEMCSKVHWLSALLCMTVGLAALGCSGCGGMELSAGEKVEQVTFESDSLIRCTFEGLDHDVVLDLPEKTEGAPLVIMLHGYGQMAENFRNEVAFADEACPKGYAVVYVTGARDQNDKTSSTGWNSGMGMNQNRDVEFLTALVRFLEEKYGFDPKRTYAVGFSNGAFMAHRLAVSEGTPFEAVVSVAGMMPGPIWEERQHTSVGVFQITGEKDDVVPKNSDGSAKNSPNPAIEDVMDYYIAENGAQFVSEETVGKATLTKYDSDKGRPVWNLFVSDGRHSWPTPEIQKVDTNRLIVEFLEANQ